MRRKARPMAIVPRQVLRMACVGVVPALMLGGCFGEGDGSSGSGGSSATGGTGGTGGQGGVGGIIIALAMAGFGGPGGFGGIIALAMAGFGGDGGDDAGTSDDAGSD